MEVLKIDIKLNRQSAIKSDEKQNLIPKTIPNTIIIT